MSQTHAISPQELHNVTASVATNRHTAALQYRLQSLGEELTTHQASIDALMQNIEHLRQDAPDPSNYERDRNGALTARGQQALQQAQAKHDQAIQALLSQVKTLYVQLARLQAQLESLSAQLPAAQLQDATELLRQTERERARLGALAPLAKDTIDATEGSREQNKRHYELRWRRERIDLQNLNQGSESADEPANLDQPSLKVVIRYWTLQQAKPATSNHPGNAHRGQRLGNALSIHMLQAQNDPPNLDSSAWSTAQRQAFGHISTQIAAIAQEQSVAQTADGASPAEHLPATLPQTVTDRWQSFVSELKLSGAADVSAVVQAALRASYMSNTEDLRFYAEKVKYFNAFKQAIRDELTRARNTKADIAKSAHGMDPSIPASFNPGTWDDPIAGRKVPIHPGKESGANKALQPWSIKNIGDLNNYIEALEEHLTSVGDDAQLANVDLQNMLQKQQQGLTLLTNISKVLHDTAMRVLKNVS